MTSHPKVSRLALRWLLHYAFPPHHHPRYKIIFSTGKSSAETLVVCIIPMQWGKFKFIAVDNKPRSEGFKLSKHRQKF